MFNCGRLDKKNKALESIVKPTRATISGLQSLCLVRANLQKGEPLVFKNLRQTPEQLKAQTEAEYYESGY